MEPGQVELDWKTYGAAIGHRCKLLRVRLSLTQQQLGDRAGVSRTWVQALERGFRKAGDDRPTNVSVHTLYALAYALEVPPVFLLPDAGKPVEERSGEVQGTVELDDVFHLDVVWPTGVRAELSRSMGDD